MNKNIVIVGTGSSGLIGKSIAHLIPNDAIIVDVNNVKEQLPFPKSEPFIIHKHPELKAYGEKEFVSKGKHQYKKNINGEWKCQCGKQTN